MSDPFSYSGEWWFAGAQSDTFQGIFTFTPGKESILRVDDFAKKALRKNREEYPVFIQGYLRDTGKPVTLISPMMESGGSETYRANGAATITGLRFFIEQAHIGAHFNTEKDILLRRISLEYPHLHEWVNISGFTRDNENENPYRGEISVQYKRPPDISLGTVDGFTFSITFGHTFPGRHTLISDNEITISQAVFLRIEAEVERPYKDFRNAMECLNNLLSIALIKDITATSIKAYSDNFYYMLDERQIPSDVEILDMDMIGDTSDEKLRPWDMLFTYHDIKATTEKIIEKCNEMSAEWGYTLSLFLTVLGGRVHYLEHQFLNLAQAIEGFHRITRDRPELDEEEHRERIQSILSVAPPEYQTWLEEKLKWSNEISFSRRLKDIFKVIGPILDINSRKRDALIKGIVDARNSLVHLMKGHILSPFNVDGTMKDEETHDKEVSKIYDAVQVLKILLELSLALQIGISTDIIKAKTEDRFSSLQRNMSHLGLIKKKTKDR